MMRVCNLDTCPVGVATQNPELRKRFHGKPEYVINFMRFMAQEMREYMAKLGIHTVDELVESKYDIAELKNMIEKHVAHTGSEKGKEILTHFDEYLPKFKKIIPNDYKRMMMLSAQMEDKGLSSEQAQIEAFYESMRK